MEIRIPRPDRSLLEAWEYDTVLVGRWRTVLEGFIPFNSAYCVVVLESDAMVVLGLEEGIAFWRSWWAEEQKKQPKK